MYTKFYNLKEKPFNLTPDSHFFYLSSQHRDALGHLLYGIRERKGFMLVSGEVGTGKTTLCRALIREIENEAEVGFIINTFLSGKELLRAINDDLGCHAGAGSRKELIDELNRFLLRHHETGRNVVVLIDECQNLEMPALEQLRMISNLETEKTKLLQIVMVGQPELREKLWSERLRQLSQRISVSYHLRSLDRGETVNYINHRMRIASGADGGNGNARFSRAALRRIFLYSEGIPRKINILCDRALLVGFVRGKRKITDEIVRAAISEIARHKTAGRKTRRISPFSILWRAAVPALLIAGFALLVLPLKRHEPPAAGKAERRVVERGLPAKPREEPPRPAAQHLTPEAEAAIILARIWGRSEVPPGIGESGKDIAALASPCGMDSVSLWADPSLIRRMNLPCVLKLADAGGDGTIPAIVKTMSRSGATLVYPGGAERTFTDVELAGMMRGRVVLFLPPGAGIPPVLAPGMRGNEIRKLRRSLAALNILKKDGADLYDGAVEEAVRRFQMEYGLPADGIAGVNENIMIRSMSAGGAIPRLTSGGPGLK